MLNFTDHMKRIIQLAEQAMKNVEEQNFTLVQDAIVKITLHNKQAEAELDDALLMRHQGRDPAERVE